MLKQFLSTSSKTPLDVHANRLLPVAARDVGFSIDSKDLLHDINLTLSGEHLTVIMGPNGAGKSLLLRMLHGLIKPDHGTIQWAGKPMSRAIQQRQAMVFQRPVLLRRSAAANIDFVLRLTGHAGKKRRDALLAQAGLAGKEDQPARLLSGGEQQRLSLARALALEPDVIFLDEPTASLDPASVAKIEEIVRAAHLAGTKIIFVTHDVAQAKRLAGEVVFMNHGRIEEHAGAKNFFERPRSAAARAYLEGRIVE